MIYFIYFSLFICIAFLLIKAAFFPDGISTAFDKNNDKKITKKESAILNIKTIIEQNNLNLEDVKSCFIPNENTDTTNLMPTKKQSKIKTVFIYIGAILILSGFGAYIESFWDEIGSLSRVVLSLGVGYSLLFLLNLALKSFKPNSIIAPLTILTAFFTMVGWGVLFDEYFKIQNEQHLLLSIFSIMVIQYSILFFKYRKTLLLSISILFFYSDITILFDLFDVADYYLYTIIGASLFVVGSSFKNGNFKLLVDPLLFIGAVFFYMGVGTFCVQFELLKDSLVMVIGISLIITTLGIDENKTLLPMFYFMGGIMFYSGAFYLLRDTFIEPLYVVITAGGLYLCLHMKSLILLILNVISMMSFIWYYSSEYFIDSIGFPLFLILVGICFLGIGGIALKVNKKIKIK